MSDIVLQDGSGRRPGLRQRLRAAVAAAAAMSRPLSEIGNHVWLTLGMVAIGAALHYAFPVSFSSQSSPFQLPSQTMHRIFFMVPVAYAGFIFGPRGGFLTLLAVTPLMLPKALLGSSDPSQDLLEICSIVVVSSLIILWFGGQRQERDRREEILSRLELARQELASQVEQIKKNERRLAAINEVCCVISQALALPVLLERILGQVVLEMGVDAALIFLKDEATQKLGLVAHRGISEEFARAVVLLNVGEGFNGRVAQSGESMEVLDSSHDPRRAIPEVVQEGIQSQLIVPLHSKGVIIGSLCVAMRSNRHFSAYDRELLTAMSSQVGIAIENAHLYQEALISEEKYRDLFENATVAIFVQDMKGTITAANKACTKLTGYPVGDLFDNNVTLLFPPRAVETLAAVQRNLILGGPRPGSYDIPMTRRDGVESILAVTTRLVSEKGQPRGFQHIAIDVTETRRMRDTLNSYVRQVLTAQEEERKRISRELHDETAQSLLLILQITDSLSTGSARKLSAHEEKGLEQLRAVVLQTLADLRRLTRDLRPQILDDLGLVAAVEWLAEEMERQSGIKTAVHVEGPQRELTPEAQLLLFRITQESLSNVKRHSAASSTEVALQFEDGRVKLIIEDDGQGFKVPGSMSELAGAGKLGILGMSERARLVGGSITVRSDPGRGTTVVAELAG